MPILCLHCGTFWTPMPFLSVHWHLLANNSSCLCAFQHFVVASSRCALLQILLGHAYLCVQFGTLWTPMPHACFAVPPNGHPYLFSVCPEAITFSVYGMALADHPYLLSVYSVELTDHPYPPILNRSIQQ